MGSDAYNDEPDEPKVTGTKEVKPAEAPETEAPAAPEIKPAE